jgi:TRAP-type C4-dicarboxylate transport system permease small subunit
MDNSVSATSGNRTGSGVRHLHRARLRVVQILEFCIFLMVLTILALVFTQVFTRYVLHVPVNWLEEAARMTLVWLVMIGAVVAAERHEHYLINMIVDALPRRLALVTLTVTNLLGVVFLVVLAITGYAYVVSAMSTTYVSLNVPRGYIYAAVPIGAVLMCFTLVTQSIEAWFARDAVKESGA